MVGNRVVDIIDEITISNQNPQIPGMEYDKKKLILGYMDDAEYNLQRLIKRNKKINEETEDEKYNRYIESMEKYGSLYCVLKLSKDYVQNMMEFAEVDGTIMTHEYNVSNKICIFPISKKRTLFMAFGSTLRHLMYEITTKEEWKDFREKYGVKDYHYQNQTDRPDDISQKEWSRRRKDWDIVMPTGIPREDGTVVEISQKWDIQKDLFYMNGKTAMEYIESKESRVARKAKAKTICSELGDDKNEWQSIIWKRERLFREKDEKVMSLYEENKKMFEKILPDITIEMLANTPISI